MTQLAIRDIILLIKLLSAFFFINLVRNNNSLRMTEYLRTPHVISEAAVKENTLVLGSYREIGHYVSQQALGRLKAATMGVLG